MASIAAFLARSRPAVMVTVVTNDEMDTEKDHQSLTVSEMEAGQIEEGRVAVQDIPFDFDSTIILPESPEALATVADLMHDAPRIDLLVVGHTDNSGAYNCTLSLSMDRARAVVSYLSAQHGLEACRLQAAKAAMIAPIATNCTEERQSLKRRVDLVEMSQ